jgi:hypothetical protein
MSRCPGCGAVLPEKAGPTHRYLESSPACWAKYGEVLSREYGERRLFQSVHRLTVDTYAVQHPGRPSPQSMQSVAVHLMSLHVTLDTSSDPGWAARVIREAVRVKGRYPWLTPPGDRGPITVADVSRAGDAAEHERRVGEWAAAVWKAWAPHHRTVRLWCASLGRAQEVPR